MVERIQVTNEPFAFTVRDDGVTRRDERIIKKQDFPFLPPDRRVFVVQVEGTSVAAVLNDHHQGGAPGGPFFWSRQAEASWVSPLHPLGRLGARVPRVRGRFLVGKQLLGDP